MANISVTKVKIRRGTDTQRKSVIFDQGELGFVTDASSLRIFVGDGLTYGGHSVAMKFYAGDRELSPDSFSRAQVGDLIYDTTVKNLFILTGADTNFFPDYSNVEAYQNIGTQADNSTIEYNADYQLSVKNTGISAIHIADEAFSFANGFLREPANGAFKINIDNDSIQLNINRQLYVDPRSIDWTLLPTTYPGAGTKKMWIDTANGNVVKVAL